MMRRRAPTHESGAPGARRPSSPTLAGTLVFLRGKVEKKEIDEIVCFQEG